MTVPRLREMTEYWRQNPPLHLMVAAYFGVGNQSAAVRRPEEEQGDINELFSFIPQVPHNP